MSKRCVCVSALFLLLFTQLFSNWFTSAPALAATKPPVASGHLTLAKFLAEQPNARLYDKTFHFPGTPPPPTVFPREHLPNYQHTHRNSHTCCNIYAFRASHHHHQYTGSHQHASRHTGGHQHTCTNQDKAA